MLRPRMSLVFFEVWVLAPHPAKLNAMPRSRSPTAVRPMPRVIALPWASVSRMTPDDQRVRVTFVPRADSPPMVRKRLLIGLAALPLAAWGIGGGTRLARVDSAGASA